jgi:hypothetical protein
MRPLGNPGVAQLVVPAEASARPEVKGSTIRRGALRTAGYASIILDDEAH